MMSSVSYTQPIIDRLLIEQPWVPFIRRQQPHKRILVPFFFIFRIMAVFSRRYRQSLARRGTYAHFNPLVFSHLRQFVLPFLNISKKFSIFLKEKLYIWCSCDNFILSRNKRPCFNEVRGFKQLK